jgi:hypothetical protein
MEKTVKTHVSGAHHFSTRSHPTFGRSRKPFDETNPPNTVTDSPYYWWFMFLRLNEEYRATCLANGKGKCADLYKDFGDVYKTNFKDWWNARVHLFSEPRKGYRMKIANTNEELAPFNSEEVINLVVPLTWSRRVLRKRFSELVLNKLEKGKRGVSVIESEAKYKLGGKWNIEAFQLAYDIYVEKQKSLSENRKVPLADIAIRAKLPYAIREKAKEGVCNSMTVDIRYTLTVLANRHYKRAEKFIGSSITKTFPYAK